MDLRYKRTGVFFLPVGVAQYDEKGCRSVPMLGRYRGNLAEMTLDFENMFSAVELRLRKDSFALEPIKVKQVILQGNDGEILAGSIKVVASRQELPDSVCEERKVSPCSRIGLRIGGGADGRIDLFLSACTACGVSPRVFVNGRDGS